MRSVAVFLIGTIPAVAAVCSPADLQGPYGFQISGDSTISGKPAPVSGVGRLVLDATGNVSGYSSVNFNGYFLGNPVTGKYEAASDCSVTFSLQDDSGGWQHFKGTARPGGSRVDYAQTDPGAGSTGSLRRLPALCSDAGFQGQYRFSLAGTSTPFSTAPAPPPTRTTATADGAGGVDLTRGTEKVTGSYSVDSDCFVQIEIGAIKLRGVLVDGGAAVLAMQTDPEHVGSATFLK